MNRTKVEWVKNPDGSQGYSWNPITGCLAGCEYCYARKLANGRLRATYLANNNLPSHNEPNHKEHLANPFYPRFWPERLKELEKAKSWTYGGGRTRVIRQRDTTSKGIFVCNMCELFGDWVPTDWKREIFEVIRANTQHRFYFLTNQPWNLAGWSPFPDNCWVGVTVCDTQTAWRALWYYFDGTVKAKLKFISFEPLLDDMIENPVVYGIGKNIIPKADWIIIGSQTKPYNPPKIEWVQAIVEAADEAGKPVFLKDNLKPLLGNNLRQELPECKHPSSGMATL
jgi:protein gp37